MKNTIKNIAAGTLFAILLLAGNVKAEGAELNASSIESIESTLQLEKWMTDESTWNINTVICEEYIPEAELSLGLEDWMINDKTWNTENCVIETELTIESWMINGNLWI